MPVFLLLEEGLLRPPVFCSDQNKSLFIKNECGTVLYKHECIKDIQKDFDHIFEVSQEIDDNFKLSFGARLIKVVLATFRTLF